MCGRNYTRDKNRPIVYNSGVLVYAGTIKVGLFYARG